MSKLVLLFAIACGLIFAYIDSRPNFDDAGILVFGIVVVAAAFGFVWPIRVWRWALAIGTWIPLFSIIRAGEFASLVAIAFAFAGAYIGAGIRRSQSRLA
jgi:hypothetical protein